jgi:hypothetical protein
MQTPKMPDSDPLAAVRNAVTGLAPAGRIRASDSDREAAAERIRRAYVEGRLTLDEFDVRTASAWAATTRAELEALTNDLPLVAHAAVPTPLPAPVPMLPVTPAKSGVSKGRQALRVLTIIWATVSLMNFGIWALVCVSALQWIYPWWLWVLVPAGTAIAVLNWYVNPPRRND